jgi:hypothetical protein
MNYKKYENNKVLIIITICMLIVKKSVTTVTVMIINYLERYNSVTTPLQNEKSVTL